jgi:hypothetical protein
VFLDFLNILVLFFLIVRNSDLHPYRTNIKLQNFTLIFGARGSMVVKALCYKPEGRVFGPDEVNQFFFSNYLILQATLVLGVYSASNRNECQKQKIMFLGSRERPVRRADILTAICEPIV